MPQSQAVPDISICPRARAPRARSDRCSGSRARAIRRTARARFGDMFTLNIDGAPWVMLSDPEDVHTVFTGGADVMHAGEANAPLEPSRPALDPAARRAEHLRQRQLMLPAVPRRADAAATRRHATRRARRDSTPGAPARAFALLPHTQAVTLEVILRAVFGVEEGLAARAPARGRLQRLLRQRPRIGGQLVQACCSGPTPSA